MSDDYGARRKFPRIASANTLLVKRLAPSPAEGFGRTRVVGLGGCMFENEEPLGVGAEVELHISVVCRVIRAVGRVVYEIPRPAGHVDVGVEFLKLAEGDREVIEGLFDPAFRDAPEP